jgi:osmotically-inducible protein OsmY
MRYSDAILSEGEIRQEVLRELWQESRLKGTDIQVEVRDATATLSGTVATSDELLAAVEAARRVPA